MNNVKTLTLDGERGKNEERSKAYIWYAVEHRRF